MRLYDRCVCGAKIDVESVWIRKVNAAHGAWLAAHALCRVNATAVAAERERAESALPPIAAIKTQPPGSPPPPETHDSRLYDAALSVIGGVARILSDTGYRSDHERLQAVRDVMRMDLVESLDLVERVAEDVEPEDVS